MRCESRRALGGIDVPLQHVEAKGQGGVRDDEEISNLTVPSTATTTDTADTVAAPNVDGVPACFM